MKKLNLILIAALLMMAVILVSPVSAVREKPLKDVILQYKFIGDPYKYVKSGDMVRDIGFKWNNPNAYPVKLTIVVTEKRPNFNLEVLRYTTTANPGRTGNWFIQKVLYHASSRGYKITSTTERI